MIGITAAANLRADTGEQLVFIDRSQQVIGDADLQTTKQSRIAVGIGDGKDRNVPRALQRADLAAQPQAVEIFQPERHDEKIVIVLGGMKQRL